MSERVNLMATRSCVLAFSISFISATSALSCSAHTASSGTALARTVPGWAAAMRWLRRDMRVAKPAVLALAAARCGLGRAEAVAEAGAGAAAVRLCRSRK